MAEGGRSGRQEKKGEGKNSRRAKEQITVETDSSGEKEMEIGKEECRARVTFEVGKSSISNRRRPGKRGTGRRHRRHNRSRQDDHGEMETLEMNQ